MEVDKVNVTVNNETS